MTRQQINHLASIGIDRAALTAAVSSGKMMPTRDGSNIPMESTDYCRHPKIAIRRAEPRDGRPPLSVELQKALQEKLFNPIAPYDVSESGMVLHQHAYGILPSMWSGGANSVNATGMEKV